MTVVARNASALDAVASEIGGHALPADLLDRTQIDGLIARAEAVGGPVRVLVNGAGVAVAAPLVELTTDEIDQMIRLNLLAPIELSRQALPAMIGAGGHIVNISSMASSGGFTGLTAYCATKAGLSHFTRVARLDLRGTPVKLTTVEVGPVPTAMMAGIRYPPTDASFRRLRRMQLMPNTSVERLSRATVDAIEKGRGAVRLPRRAAAFPLLSAAPQRMVEALVRGIK